jgi:hypothetical protein
MEEEKLIILVQGHECLYNLQRKYYESKVRDNCWKVIAGELHAQDKELYGHSTVGVWQSRGRRMAWYV